MKAARFYLFVLMIYSVLNHQSVDGGILSFLNPIEDGLKIVQMGVGIVNDIKKLFSSPTHEIDDLMDEMLDLSYRVETMEQNFGVQIADGFQNLQQQFQTRADLSNHGLQQLQEEAVISHQMMQRILEQAKLSDLLLKQLLTQASLSHGLLQQLQTQAQLSDHLLKQLLTQARQSHGLLQQLQTRAELSDLLRDLNNQMGKINRKYDLLKRYANRTMSYENFTLSDFASTCLSHDDDGVTATLDKLHSLIIPDRHGFRNLNLLNLIGDDLKEKINTTHCSDEQSHQYDLLYGLLNPIVITEIKGLALMQFSYMFLRLYGQGNFTTESQLIQNRYQTRLDETLDALRTAMPTASPDVWRCDPPEWKENDTYTQSYIYYYDYYNVREVVADITSNKVITGMRFVRINGKIELQIEQGELLGDGMIANNTEWIDPDANNTNGPNLTTDGVRIFSSVYVMGIELDEITAPPGHCLTGVKIATVPFKGNLHLRLEIRTTPFNFTTGKLIEPLTRSRWLGSNHTTPRTRVTLTRSVRPPTFPKLQSIPNFGINQYIKHAFFDVVDNGFRRRLILPFIDTQPVLPSPRVALAGAGFYYKGRDGYDGFVAPKLKTYNFTNQLGTD